MEPEDYREMDRRIAERRARQLGLSNLRELAASMRAEVAASPGVIHLEEHNCHCCGCPVGPEGRSKRNPNLYLCSSCRLR